MSWQLYGVENEFGELKDKKRSPGVSVYGATAGESARQHVRLGSSGCGSYVRRA